MSDEIKEILDKAKEISKYTADGKQHIRFFNQFEAKSLLDYITNLQQENKRLKRDYAKIVNDNCDYLKLEQENEMMRKLINKGVENSYIKLKELQQENESLRTRIKTIKRLRKKQTAKKNKYKAIIFNEEKALHDYKSRCEKAIEYIKNCEIVDKDKRYPLLEEQFGEDLLNILQNGSDSQ